LKDSTIAEGVGKVKWHSLNESGKAKYYDVQFKDKLIRNIPASELIRVNEQTHKHETQEEKE